jgi:hypothetical protein
MNQETTIDRAAFFKALAIAFGFLVISASLQFFFAMKLPHSLQCSVDSLFTDLVVLRGQPLLSAQGLIVYLIIKVFQTLVLFWVFLNAFGREKQNKIWVTLLLLLVGLLLIPIWRIPAI